MSPADAGLLPRLPQGGLAAVALQAYEDEQRGQGLKDQTIIQFFGIYVHDLLAAFAQDSTLPSDPRVIYMGGNNKMKYAVNPPRRQNMPHRALG